MVVALFVCLELFTNLVLETVLYAGAAGVSQVALLVSVAFWTWLWGPLGLLLATPLTVCLVVLGKHVPGLEFLGTLMADRPALAPEYNYYQRLLARDQSEAADLVERHIKSHLPVSVYDALLLPALNYAERDRLEGRLSEAEESLVSDSTRELITDAADWIREVAPELSESTPIAPAPEPPGPRQALRVLGYAANGTPDVLALHMLTHLVEDLPIDLEVHSTRLGTNALVSLLRDQKISVLCIADLPPSPPSRTRYVVKRLRAALPDLRILVGRWAPEALADERSEGLRADGATHVARALLDTRDYLAGLLELPRVAVSDQPDIHAA